MLTGGRLPSLKVLHVIDHTGPGGAQVVVEQLARALQGGFIFEVAILGTSAAFSDRYRALGIKVHELGGTQGRWSLAALPRLVHLVRRGQYRWIHTHLFKSYLFGAVAGACTGTDLILHDHTGIYPGMLAQLDYLPNRLARRTYTALYSAALKMSKVAIVLTPEMHTQYVETYPTQAVKFVVIPNGVDIRALQDSAAVGNTTTIRHQLGLAAQTKLIVMVARLDTKKDWPTFLAVAERVRHQHRQPLAFLAVGSGTEEQTLRKQVEEQRLTDIYFLGHRTDVPALLLQADAFLLTSKVEPFGIVVLEAMACGCPVVATRSGGPNAILTHAGDGLLADVGDVDGLSNHVLRILREHDLGQKLAQQAKRTVEQFYSIHSVSKRVAEIYERTMQRA